MGMDNSLSEKKLLDNSISPSKAGNAAGPGPQDKKAAPVDDYYDNEAYGNEYYGEEYGEEKPAKGGAKYKKELSKKKTTKKVKLPEGHGEEDADTGTEKQVSIKKAASRKGTSVSPKKKKQPSQSKK